MHKNKVLFTIIFLSLLAVAPRLSEAAAFLDFELPTFTPDFGGNFDNAHTFVGPDGSIDFNGRIWNFVGGQNIGDHTPYGQGYFWRSTESVPVLTMTFDYDVLTLDFFWYALAGFTGHTAIFDSNGTLLDSAVPAGSDAWFNAAFGGYDSAIREIQFWSTNANGEIVGNRLALDDINVSAGSIGVIPEPSSLLFLGIGLGGLFRKRKV